MAKGQKRGNREQKKPKATKTAAPPPSHLLPKGLSPSGGAFPKKKG